MLRTTQLGLASLSTGQLHWYCAGEKRKERQVSPSNQSPASLVKGFIRVNLYGQIGLNSCKKIGKNWRKHVIIYIAINNILDKTESWGAPRIRLMRGIKLCVLRNRVPLDCNNVKLFFTSYVFVLVGCRPSGFGGRYRTVAPPEMTLACSSDLLGIRLCRWKLL